jgi:hypothetical protein
LVYFCKIWEFSRFLFVMKALKAYIFKERFGKSRFCRNISEISTVFKL